jgi:5'-3' exonuclease
VIESFRNDLWPGYKTSAGIEPALCWRSSIRSRSAAGDGHRGLADGRAGGGRCARLGGTHRGARRAVEKVCIWTPDKDLRQCVSTDRVVQVDRAARRSAMRAGCARSSASSRADPGLLALVGDAADGYPWISGHRPVRAAQLLNRTARSRPFPPTVLADRRELALLFKRLATLRTDAPLFKRGRRLRWTGATEAFANWTERMEAPRLAERAVQAYGAMA